MAEYIVFAITVDYLRFKCSNHVRPFGYRQPVQIITLAVKKWTLGK